MPLNEPQNQLWRIEGILTARSPLHVGDGRKAEQNADHNDAEISTFCRDVHNRPYIPGSSLRGFLREAFRRRYPSTEESLFGFQDLRSSAANAAARGGLLSVWDAPSTGDAIVKTAHHVVIDRQTRTADDGLLFFEEFLPAGTTFSINLVIECAKQHPDEDVAQLVRQLLGLLKDLHNDPGRLGSNTASGYGHVGWSMVKVSKLTPKALQSWLASDKQLIDCLEKDNSIAADPFIYKITDRYLPIKVVLNFTGPFLVNNPDAAKKKGPQHDDSKANHVAMETPDKRCRLPGSSLHGALRSQTERIARTIAGTDENARNWVRNVGKPTAATENYRAVDCLWGGVGLRSPIRVSDFEAKQAETMSRQEFVAIDRFTGGGADSLKFNADGFVRPVLHGELLIDLNALKALKDNAPIPPHVRPDAAGWDEVLLLLAFCIRDWMEGDIHLGFGASKGYGHCTAHFPDYPTAKHLFNKLTQCLNQ